MQRRAVMEAATHGVFVLTGGPGTGKTTIIKTIVQILQDKDKIRKEKNSRGHCLC